MKIDKLNPGRYILAVSGGVDSVTLLDILSKQKNLKLVVAHFDHGIREDSAKDRKLVESLVKKYNLLFEYAEVKLGKSASEAVAREARYKFLRDVQKKHQAKAIITAHHQDDLIETIMLNLLRGTGRKGITSLKNQDDLLRPLLGVTKKEIIAYAKKHNLKWHDESTNANDTYLRNWLRHNIIPKLSDKDREKFLKLWEDFSERNPEIDELLASYIKKEVNKFPRQDIIMADHAVAKELVAGWLRANNIKDFDQKTIERIVIGAKTYKNGKIIPVVGNKKIEVTKENVILQP